MLKDQRNLWEVLDLKPGAKSRQVDEAYREKLKQNKSKILRLAWKILRDPFYASAYSCYPDLKKMEEAGFFDDGLGLKEDDSSRFDPNYLTTPLDKILKNLRLKKNGKPVVLLSTGAFFPLHKGHIDMMRIAKSELEQRGFWVVGGYYSPSHENYLFRKYGKPNKKLVRERLFLCQNTVKDSDWLEIDPWETRYNKTYINFTEIIFRLENYLKFHIPQSIEVFYVFGGDNIGFSRAFIKKGKAICVPRDQYKNFEPFLKENPELANKKTIIFAKEPVIPLISSSKVRLKVWKSETESKISEEKGVYVIRNDDQWCIEPWIKKGRQNLVEETGVFLNHLEKRVRNILTNKPSVKFCKINLDDQIRVARENKVNQKINLDVCLQGKYNLNISRLFALSSAQIKAEKMVTRPGYDSLNVQLKKIPKGVFDLIDDDIASGQTIDLVLKLLAQEQIEIQKIDSLLEKTFESLKKFKITWNASNKTVFDVVDFRDFLFGSKESGLVVSLPNEEIARAPYTLPYVSLLTRAKISSEKEVEFSKDLWQMNLNFFERIKPDILLEEANQGFQKLMFYLGFRKKDRMADICKWHLERHPGSQKG